MSYKTPKIDKDVEITPESVKRWAKMCLAFHIAEKERDPELSEIWKNTLLFLKKSTDKLFEQKLDDEALFKQLQDDLRD